MKKILTILLLSFISVLGQQLKENQISDNAITRNKLNADSTGKAVIKRLFSVSPLTVTSSGVDTGTGDVTVEIDSTEYLKIDSITATNNYIPKMNTTKKFVNSQLYDNATNIGIGTINPFGFFQITRDPLNTSQPTGIYNSSGDSHTGFFLSGKGNALNEKFGIQFGNYENYAIGGIFSLMTSSGGTTIGDLTIDLRASTGDLLLTERMRIKSTGQVYYGTLVGGSKVNVSGAIATDSVFISTISSTTPPLIVTSNKQVTNLNADMLDSLHASDFSSVYHDHSGTYCRWRGSGSSDPTSPISGDIYYNTVTGTVLIYVTDRWIDLIP